METEGKGVGLAPLVKPGMRAFTILTPTIAPGVVGFILPGNRVDVLLTMTESSQNANSGGGYTTTLLQNVEVIAVDQQMKVPEEHGTVSTTPSNLFASPKRIGYPKVCSGNPYFSRLIRAF